ncbi:MAG: hydrogenase nickel incorporation protein HypB [Clostridiaceae bacterium]|nr:hydrogenase nickel incorporation protein HypB [Clostridiaceae bacterium]
MKKKVEVMEDIYARNDQIADYIQKDLSARGLFAVNVMGAPGTGKTSCLIRIIERLDGIKAYVIEGDIQSDIDTQKLKALGIESVQINTGGACHLDSPIIEKALAKLDLSQKGIIFIENIGNLVCPAEFNIGENIKLLISTVTEGADKPYKYPLAFEKAGLIILNKTDLTPYVDFDRAYFEQGVRALNPQVPIFEVSAKTGAGFDEVISWLKSRL